MRKVFSLFLLLLSVTISSFSQQVNELDFLTSGKWQVESIQIGEELQEFSENNNWMIFHADGKYQVVMNNSEKRGNWKLEEASKVIKFEEDENLANGLKIELLNKKELLFSATEGDIVYTMKLKR
ncbi:hypothetical protein [Tenacibaculum soleae]|uniref:Lipocalin-like domain-containing protein n=1 Tax=Tenacibaculum soleae TaxID=447689 RepID=A0A1B9XYW0_9FLAO|nr:hypothetical protein [Tenacibaculum soleae]MDO6743800.1 hypothetical protein [Tenacibaculum soleae]MDO6812203.1 hypothetical protein [Tenacibaculum soleae]OCK42722.1 hypothetical protein BA195_07365 [Tenacibaculum soleae]